MKKSVILFMAATMCMMLLTAAGAKPAAAQEVQEFTNSLLKTVDDSNKDEAYYESFLEACIYNNKVIRNYPFTLEE